MADLLIPLYLVGGFIYMLLEAQTLEYADEFEGMEPVDIALSVAVMSVMLLRACLVYPLYIIEDACIWTLNKRAGEDEE